MRAQTASFLVAASLTLFACSSPSSSSTPPGTTPPSDVPVASSEQPRITAPVVPSTDADALRDGNTAFAADLYQSLRNNPDFAGKNLFFSPHSISLALAMAYAGARGTTETQWASTLHYTLPQDRLHPAFDALDLALASRGQGAKGDDGKAFRLRTTNSIWGAPQTKFVTTFLDTLAASYGANVRLTDFAADPEAARGKINAWVDHETEDRIKELLPAGTIDQMTRMVLVNAIYFNAAWSSPFQKNATRSGTFHGLGGDAPAQMMAQGGEMQYAKGDGWQAVALPYDGNELSFVAVVPDQLDAFETAFSADQANSIVSSLSTKSVQLELPRFKIEGSSFSLRDTLVSRGMTDAFDPVKADLTGMSSTEKLWISDVIHQAFVSVDESGTEAAAATAVVVVGGAMPPTDVVKLSVDRPFVFFVRDNATGAILFLGRVVTV